MITISITDVICIVIASMALGVNISNAVRFWLVGRKWGSMTREEKLKLLLDTGEYDFIKYISKENIWKLIFALAYIEDTIKTDVIDKIRAEIENHCGLIKENHCRYCSYCNSVMGVREILEIIDKCKTESEDKNGKLKEMW